MRRFRPSFRVSGEETAGEDEGWEAGRRWSETLSVISLDAVAPIYILVGTAPLVYIIVGTVALIYIFTGLKASFLTHTHTDNNQCWELSFHATRFGSVT